MYPGHGDGEFDQALTELAQAGATHVALNVFWAQRDVRSNSIRPTEAATVGGAQLRRTIARARDLGLEVIVFPILRVEQRATGQWRGTVQPRDVDAWWSSYRAFILHYAAVAAQEGATALVVGSELASTEHWRDRWYALIGAVRLQYAGTVVYSANWDHYDKVSFWSRVDAIGVSAYFELTSDSEASVDDLARAWEPHRRSLVAYARRLNRPLWITEVGYPSRDGGAVRPWDYTADTRVDLEEQRRAFAAFARAWGRRDGLSAVLFWNWWGRGGPDDRSYTPRGKPSLSVIRSFFGGDGQSDVTQRPAPAN